MRCVCVCPPFIWFGRLIRAKSNFLLRLALPPLVKPAPAFVTASYKKTHTHTATSAFCISLLIKEKQNHVTETDKHITSHGRKRKKNNNYSPLLIFLDSIKPKKKKEKTVCGVKTVNLFSDTSYHTLGRLVIVSLD